MAQKRKRDELEDAIDQLPNNWQSEILQQLNYLTPEGCTAIMVDLLHKLQISDRDIKRSRTDLLPSFSNAKWLVVADQLKLPRNPKHVHLDHFFPPNCVLPPSMLKNMFKEGWKFMDVYKEKVDYVRDDSARGLKLLEPVLVSILALFEGRMVDIPEPLMMATKYFSGGAVEHQIVAIGGVLFFVVDLNLMVPDQHLAQVFLQLLAAAEANGQMAGYEHLPVCGLLTNMTIFRFFTYSPVEKKFFRDKRTYYSSPTREAFSKDMILVSNKIFSVLIYGYIESLRATVALNKARHNKDTSTVLQQSTSDSTSMDWQNGLDKAEEGYAALQACFFEEDLDKLEEMATHALQTITDSVRCLPRYSSVYTGPEEGPVTPEILDEMADKAVSSWHVDRTVRIAKNLY